MANVWLIYGYSVCFFRNSESHGRAPLSLEGLFHGTNLKRIITGGTPMTKGKPPYDGRNWRELHQQRLGFVVALAPNMAYLMRD